MENSSMMLSVSGMVIEEAYGTWVSHGAVGAEAISEAKAATEFSESVVVMVSVGWMDGLGCGLRGWGWAAAAANRKQVQCGIFIRKKK